MTGATIACTQGLATGSLVGNSPIKIAGMPALTINDTASFVNVTPCGMCTSIANPTVAAATASALGVLTPMPCIPNPVGIWQGCTNSPSVGGKKALSNEGKLICAYGGTISIVFPGQTTVSF